MAKAKARELETYRSKRDFGRTPEPSGQRAARPSGRHRFVVQRHRARRLHYDLRLEVESTLASWAVPKGPTLDPKARLLAVQVEDHPLEYFDFEGVIPAGEYGGGDVIVWDWGTWEAADPATDASAAIEAGELHFDLHGEKLVGRFVLVRRDHRGGKSNWLLIHKRDEHAQEGWDPEDHPRSVKSGRTNDEVKAAPDARWRSDLPPGEAAVALAPSTEELDELDALGKKGTWRLGGRELKLTNLDKVLFPGQHDEPPVTKRDLIRYHACVAPAMLPYLVDRPLNLHRYPDGVDRPGFWHKARPSHAPSWIGAWRNDEADPGETEVYLTVEDAAGLAWLANYGAVEVHPWTSTVADVHRPTWAFIDIDPGTETTFDDALVLARLYRAALEHLGVAGMPKVTGRRGIQIWVPIAPRYTFEDTRTWVETLSRAVGATVPDLVSWRWQKAEREGKVRLDYTQNAINKTLVAPFSARPAPGAPVSVPIDWGELDDPDLRPDRWTIRTVLGRLAVVGDPLAGLVGRTQGLPRIT